MEFSHVASLQQISLCHFSAFLKYQKAAQVRWL